MSSVSDTLRYDPAVAANDCDMADGAPTRKVTISPCGHGRLLDWIGIKSSIRS